MKAEEDENDKITKRVLDRLKVHQKESEKYVIICILLSPVLMLFGSLRGSMRAATLQMKKNLDKRYEKDRAALFEGNAEVRKRVMEQYPPFPLCSSIIIFLSGCFY